MIATEESVQLSPIEMLVSEYIHEIKYRPTSPNDVVFQERACAVIASMGRVDWDMPVNYVENMFSGEMSPEMPLKQMLSLLGVEFLTQLLADDLRANTTSLDHSCQARRL
jgi:hypothetical protein